MTCTVKTSSSRAENLIVGRKNFMIYLSMNRFAYYSENEQNCQAIYMTDLPLENGGTFSVRKNHQWCPDFF